MDTVIVAGATCLGSAIGALLTFYFYDAGTSPRKITAIIFALAGCSVLAMFGFLAGIKAPTPEYWFYPAGLVLGFVVVSSLWHYRQAGRQTARAPVAK